MDFSGWLRAEWDRIGGFTLVGLGAVLPAALLHTYGHRMVMFGTNVHFVGVGVTALAAAVAALALTVVGVRRRDGRVVLVGTRSERTARLKACASASEALGVGLIICLRKAICTGSESSACTAAARMVSRTSRAVAAGAYNADHKPFALA